MKLLSIAQDAKTIKGQSEGYLTGILYLAPAKLSGYEVCPQRSAGCTDACLNTARRGGFNSVQTSRVNKTKLYFEDRPAFMAQLVKEIAALVRKAERDGFIPAVRLNGTSDIPWERVPVPWDVVPTDKVDDVNRRCPNHPSIFNVFSDVQFYDYTKVTKRALAYARNEMPVNYHLTFSLTEENDADAADVLKAGGTVAAVFKTLPSYYHLVTVNWLVIDGDETDLRFKDPRRVIVGFKAKGKARKDTSGFVRAKRTAHNHRSYPTMHNTVTRGGRTIMKYGQSPYYKTARQAAREAAYEDAQRLSNLPAPAPIKGRVLRTINPDGTAPRGTIVDLEV